MLSRRKLIFLLVTGYCLLFTVNASADTIYTKDRRELKGIAVEDYRDRLILSTADGEITIMKSDIAELVFDNEEDNLIKLAQLAQTKGDFIKAYTYYDMAYKLNPDSKAAKDGVVFLQGYLFRKGQVEKEELVRRHEDFERRGEAIEAERADEEKFKEASARLKNLIGISLAMKAGLPEIYTIERRSPAYEAGMRQGDLLVGVWGKLTGYMPLKEVMDILLEKPALEIKCTIERNIDIAGRDDIGASFRMEFDGLTVSGVKEGSPSFEAGLKKGDLVTAIDGEPTRYMPIKKAVESIRGSKKGRVKLTVRRELILWRGEKI